MLDSKQASNSNNLRVLVSSTRPWGPYICAAILHLGMIGLFLWQQKGLFFQQVEEIGQPIEVVYLEEKPPLPASAPIKIEKVLENKDQRRSKPTLPQKIRHTKEEGTGLSSVIEAKPTLCLKSGNPHPPYPDYAREHTIEGKVVAILQIDAATGHVRNVKIAEPRSHICLERSVVDTVKNWRFQPVNSPYLIEEIFPFEFRLSEDS